MRLEQQGLKIDLTQRFKRELKTLPKHISLCGNNMQIAIARKLIDKYGPRKIDDDGEKIQLMSLEAYATNFLRMFMEEEAFPKGLCLFYTIPEDMLIEYASINSIPVIKEEKDDVRVMLERIREKQPQTFFSLAKSAERLAPVSSLLRENY